MVDASRDGGRREGRARREGVARKSGPEICFTGRSG